MPSTTAARAGLIDCRAIEASSGKPTATPSPAATRDGQPRDGSGARVATR